MDEIYKFLIIAGAGVFMSVFFSVLGKLSSYKHETNNLPIRTQISKYTRKSKLCFTFYFFHHRL